MNNFESRANEWLAKHNVLTTFAVLAFVIGFFIWLFSGGVEGSKPVQQQVQAAPKPVQVKKDAVLCYQLKDWLRFIADVRDNNIHDMRSLFTSGKCLVLNRQTTVTYLDPSVERSALIQMPSGRAAYVLDADIIK